MTTDPDQTIEYTPDYSEYGGKDISSVPEEFVARRQGIFRDIYSVPISAGGIHYLLNRLCDQAHPWYKKIWEQVMHSSVVGSDETGGRLNLTCSGN